MSRGFAVPKRSDLIHRKEMQKRPTMSRKFLLQLIADVIETEFDDHFALEGCHTEENFMNRILLMLRME